MSIKTRRLCLYISCSGSLFIMKSYAKTSLLTDLLNSGEEMQALTVDHVGISLMVTHTVKLNYYVSA